MKDVHKSREELMNDLELLGESERKYWTYVHQSTDGFLSLTVMAGALM